MSESSLESLHYLAAQLAEHAERHDLLARAIVGCRGSYTVGTSRGGGEGAVVAAARTAITRSPPAALGGHESEP